MAKYTSGLAFYKAYKEKLERVSHDAKKLHERTARESLKDMYELTSGMTSKKTLARMNHPFGRGFANKRGGRGRLQPLPINVQSGRLRRAIYLDKRGNDFLLGIKPTAKYFKYVVSRSGTKRMITRPLWSEVEKRFKARRKAVIDTLRQDLRR
jgi:hypothetical protein